MDCIFCKIANGEIASDTVYEDDNFRVILDLSPASIGTYAYFTESSRRRYNGT
ncbi:hypothetical protein HMPREF9099_02917 [Lachnospiraceae bacterium oral taxon 082 str. F0431]|nr:hypothetical protein HMPREF9099_02917 [Lachnospiraceae bacterium oral taxon 082 str. F0431]